MTRRYVTIKRDGEQWAAAPIDCPIPDGGDRSRNCVFVTEWGGTLGCCKHCHLPSMVHHGGTTSVLCNAKEPTP
jgi:hypothetical protein